MREIIFDTETTGMDPYAGDRLVEIGCIEVVNKIKTGKTFHVYLNPEREVPEEVVKVHGLTYERLKSEPKFKEIASAFLEFVGNDKLVAHNAGFDMNFINAELAWAKYPTIPEENFIDTLPIARKRFPGQKNNLNILAKRFDIDISKRTLHGALLDADILADVYLELCGGRSLKLSLDAGVQETETLPRDISEDKKENINQPLKKLEPRNLYPLNEEEIAAHKKFLSVEKFKSPLWIIKD